MSDITIDESLFNPTTTPAEALNIVGLNTLVEQCVFMLPGCGDLMLRKTLQDVFRDLCRRTGTLTMTDTGVVTWEDPSLSLCKDYGEFLVLKSVRIENDDGELSDLALSEVELENESGQMSVLFSLPDDDDDESGDPNEYDVEAVFSYIPKIGTENAPLWYLNKYGDAIVAGTLFRLLSMPNKPWSDPTTAQLKGIEYQNALNNATIDRLTEGNYRDLNCRAPLHFV
jgi:hypothetical protein